MNQLKSLARFVKNASYSDLSENAREQLKIRLLDSLGCAIGALEAAPIRSILDMIISFKPESFSTLIGGERTAPDRAAFYNSALVRYLDFNDSYLAEGETCHPSDNVGAVLSAAEYEDRTGRDFLTALAVAYQVQCRLSDEAPVRAKGFDHTVQGSYAVAAGVSKALGLNEEQIANALAISGTAHNALRVTRTGAISNWKGLAYPNTAFCCTHASFLAKFGITGPAQVFEGNKGFMDSISGQFEIDWQRENLEKVTQTIIKKYNAEIHSQATIEGILEVKEENQFKPDQIYEIDIYTFDVAYHIIGGGEEGDKHRVKSKEEADHSLPYMIAAALLDGQVMPDQYKSERINSKDIQTLLRKIHVDEDSEYSRRFPEEMPCRISVLLKNGKRLKKIKHDYEGFHTRPMSWDTVIAKFNRLSEPYVDSDVQTQIVDLVQNIESLQIKALMNVLETIHVSRE